MASSESVPVPDPTAQLVGQSPAMHALRTQIRHLATFDTLDNAHAPTVLLQGETGTGKGLVAQVLHASGPRVRGPFVAVNCAAIPETLLEAELFGFEAGAFSEAKRAKPGLLETAAGGSLFLDEIDALSGLLQAKLLTVLEAKRVRRLGAVVEHTVDVKLIAATQAALSEAVAAGRFRVDLYHRLAVVVLDLPPLRARQDDILELAQAFLQRYAAAHGLRPKQVSPAAAGWLRSYDWPGNVRELSHLMERVMLLSAEPTLDAATLERLVLPPVGPTARQAPGPLLSASEPLDEAGRIRQALQATGGNVVQAARQLGMSRSGLRYRMQRYGLELPHARGARRATRPQSEPPPVAQVQRDVPSGTLPVPVPGWEEKLVALLVIDLTFPQRPGLEAVDSEPWTVTSHWEATLVEKVQGFGGVLVQRFAPLCLVAFGLSQGPEQLPQRAVQAALAIRQGVAEAQGRVGSALGPEARQAIHLGPLLVEGTGRAPSVRFLAVGETVSLPIRLLGHAAPGEILVSPQVGRRIAGWCTLQARAISVATGLRGQENAYRVLGLVSRRAPLAGLGARLLSRFVGRERELATLYDLLGQVKEGRGQVVRLVGEPGVGKTRLLYEFRRSLLGQQVTYLEGRCLVYGSTLPYGPVLDLLRDNCGISETDSPKVIMEKVRGSLQEVDMDPVEGAPYLLRLLGVSAGTEALAALRPETLKARTFETLLQIGLHGSQQQPLILAIEDLQWIDPTSDDFLTTLVEHLAGVPLFLLTTARPSAPSPWLRKSYATQMALAPLAPQESLRLVHAAFHTDLVPAALVQRLLAQAEGNPFFLEELMQGLVEQGVCARTPEGGITLAEAWRTRSLSAVQVPPTVQGVLAARIERLPAEAKELLQTLAVIGPACSLRLLRQVMAQPEENLRHDLMALQGAELLYERPILPEPEYTFQHALTQEVAYRSLPSAQRRVLHARTAQALEALFPTRLEAYYSMLAHHYQHSGQIGQAVDYLQRAGAHAVQRAALPEAIQQLTTAVDLLHGLPDTEEHRQQDLLLQTTLGPALMAVKGYGARDVEQAYRRAHALCRQVGAGPALGPILGGLWAFYLVRAELQTAQEVGHEQLTLAERTQEPGGRLQAHQALGVTLHHRGELAPARAHFAQAIDLYDPQQHRSLVRQYGHDPGVICYPYAASALQLLGYPDQAWQRSQQALRLAQDLAHPFSLAHVLFNIALFHYARRESQAVQERAEAVVVLSREGEFAMGLAGGVIVCGWALAAQGRGEEGMGQIGQGLAALRATGARIGEPMHLLMLAEACGQAGHVGEGLEALAEALEVGHNTGERWWEAEVYRLKGELLGKQSTDHAAEAEACLYQALDIAHHQQAKSWELRAAMSLARLWQCQGKRADAYDLLGKIYGWFTEGFDTPDLQEARGLLEELS